jgi:hypothetical protein
MTSGDKLPEKWTRYVKNYAFDLAYWYQPKGLAITSDEVLSRLQILSNFEGKKWRDCQAQYVTALSKGGISNASSKWDGGGAPLARMLKQVFITLGLAWTDANDRVEISPAGKRFLTAEGEEAAALLAIQSLKYQFWNPCVGRPRPHGAIRLHPVPFLFRLLSMMETPSISNIEYNLFVAKARNPDDIDKIHDLISEFRSLKPKVQQAIITACKSYMIGGSKRSSIYNTIQLNRSYAFRMWESSGLISADSGNGLKLDRTKNRGLVRNYLERYVSESTYIDFASTKEFFSWMGDPDSRPDKKTALEIYINRGDIDSAIKLKSIAGEPKAEIREFRKMMISEKTLEDNLMANIDIISDAVGYKITIVGRQYQTTVGPIDILAKEKSTGRYVVIELKRGRTADKVYGQLSRYMGWVRQNLADGEKVAGVIVATSIDRNLRAAVDAHDTDVKLVIYSSQISAKLV